MGTPRAAGTCPGARHRHGWHRHHQARKAGEQTRQAILVPGAIPRELCLAGTYLHHLQRQMLTLPFPVSTKSLFRPSSPCTALGWDGSLGATVAVLPWALELPIPGLPRAPRGAAFLALFCSSIRAGWTGLCHGSSAQCALPRQHCPGHTVRATAHPARGGKPPGQNRIRLRLPASIPSPTRVRGIEKRQRELFPIAPRALGSGSWALFSSLQRRVHTRSAGHAVGSLPALVRRELWA